MSYFRSKTILEIYGEFEIQIWMSKNKFPNYEYLSLRMNKKKGFWTLFEKLFVLCDTMNRYDSWNRIFDMLLDIAINEFADTSVRYALHEYKPI